MCLMKGIRLFSVLTGSNSFLILALKDLFDSSLRLCGISFHSLAPILENAIFFFNRKHITFQGDMLPLEFKM